MAFQSSTNSLADCDGFYDHLSGKPWQEIFKCELTEVEMGVQCEIKLQSTIYNLISIRQITRFLLEDAIISRKTNMCSGSAKQKRGNG